MQSSVAYGDSTVNQAAISGWLWPMTDEQIALPKLIYVNGRLVKEALISNQMRQLAQSAQLAGMGYALYFELPTQWLNVNVHPSKQRIKISPLNNIMAHLSHTIRSQLKIVNATSKVASPDNPEVSKKDVSVDNLSDTHLPNDMPIDHTRQSRQVQEPRQSYQSASSKSFPDKSLAQEPAPSYVDEPLQQSRHTSYRSSEAPTVSSLPICLDIINDAEALVIDSTATDKNLPWLLFYHQGQCLLISTKDWQSKVSQLFESSIFSNKVFKKDKMSNSAMEINQQLTTVSSQMTAQDSAVFVADLADILTRNAIKILDSHRLVTLMLSSTSE